MTEGLRSDGRQNDELRFVKFFPKFIDYPEGSVLIQMGKTRVLCNVSIQNSVPDWMKGRGKGWMTAEYAMLPRATHTRTEREYKGPSARSQEIKRLIGRSLRTVVDSQLLGERTLMLDCDVLQADGGTRCAAITAGYVALALALGRLVQAGECAAGVIKAPVAAVSVGFVGGKALLDLCYQEDSHADFDMNVVITAGSHFVELQGTAEGSPLSRAELNALIELAEGGIRELISLQEETLMKAGFS